MHKDGFTLIEIVISITILTLIAMVLSTSLALGIKARETGMTGLESLQGIRIMESILVTQIKSLYPYHMVKDSKKVIAFSGTNDSIFFTYVSSGLTKNMIRWTSYYMVNDKLLVNGGLLPDKKVLDLIEKDGEVFDCGIDKFKLEYLSDKDKWHDKWEFSESLPKAVKLDINGLEIFKIYLHEMKGQESNKPELKGTN